VRKKNNQGLQNSQTKARKFMSKALSQMYFDSNHKIEK